MAKKTKIPAKLNKYLEQNNFRHEVIEHKTVYTAFDAASTMKKKLSEIAKSLLVKADKDYYIVVLPADNNIDFAKVGKVIEKETGKKPKSVKIPGEKIMTSVFKIKAGALSAFGRVHKLPVIAEKKMTKLKKAVFPSGSFNHSIEMAVKDFIEKEEALIGSFGIKKNIKKPKAKKPVKKKAVKKTSSKKATPKKKPAAKKAAPKKNTGKKKNAKNTAKKKTNKKTAPKKK